MGVLIQIKDVPEDVHRTLKSRAALAGVSLSEYLRQLLEEVASQMSVEELFAELRAEKPLDGDVDSAALIREIRNEYD
jgi:plasmid stability protein